MTTTTDIGNRALQLLGTRTTMTSLAESSNEAIQISLALTPVQDWCFGLANWNFARATAALSVAKGPPPGSPGTWSNTYPPPPWKYEYTLPSDFIRALYITNNAATGAAWDGAPARFVLGTDTVTAVQQQVLLTNESAVNLVYISRITDPTLWRWYFERLMVTALAHTCCMALTGDSTLHRELSTQLEQHISIAIQINNSEGLLIEDHTPEWLQALGINYPYRRIDGGVPVERHSQPQRGQ